MIQGIFHQGSGLGNQLHRYVFTRVKALDMRVDFGMQNPELFKGSFFTNIDLGKPCEAQERTFTEERTNHANGTDIRPYDPKTEQIEDGTTVDGEFQSEKYFKHRIDEVREWLQCDPVPFQIPFCKQEEICVLNVRGGEYRGVDDLFLPKEYWYAAMENMKKVVPNMRFGIVTDDVELCREWFPNFFIRHDMHGDWSAINLAHYLILSNSSFAILPALLNKNVKQIIAPKYWARHNVSDGYWALDQNKYDGWFYQDKEGNLECYEVRD